MTNQRIPGIVARLMGLEFLPDSSNVVKEDHTILHLRKQPKRLSLHQLLHYQQDEDGLLQKLLDDKSVKTAKKAKDKESFCGIMKKKPLDLGVVCPQIGALKKLFIHECLYKLPKAITFFSTQFTRMSSQCLDHSKLCLIKNSCESPPSKLATVTKSSSPSSNECKCDSSRNQICCKRSPVLVEAAVKILKPSMHPRCRPRSQLVSRKPFRQKGGDAPADQNLAAYLEQEKEALLTKIAVKMADFEQNLLQDQEQASLCSKPNRSKRLQSISTHTGRAFSLQANSKYRNLPSSSKTCSCQTLKDHSPSLMKLQREQSEGVCCSLDALHAISNTGQIRVHSPKIEVRFSGDVELVAVDPNSGESSDILVNLSRTLFSPKASKDLIVSKTPKEEVNFAGKRHFTGEHSQDKYDHAICTAPRLNVCFKVPSDNLNLPVTGEDHSQLATVGTVAEKLHEIQAVKQPLNAIETSDFNRIKKITCKEDTSSFLEGKAFASASASASASACLIVEEIDQPSPVSVLDLRFPDEILGPNDNVKSFDEPMNPPLKILHRSTQRSASKCSSRCIGNHLQVGTSWYGKWVDCGCDSCRLLLDAVTSARSDEKDEVSTLLSNMGYSNCLRLNLNCSTQSPVKRDTCSLNIQELEAQHERFSRLLHSSRALSESAYETMLFECVEQALGFSQSCQNFEGGSLLKLNNINACAKDSCKKPVSLEIHNLVRRDMSINLGRWMSLRVEIQEIGLEVEHMLFEALLLELASYFDGI